MAEFQTEIYKTKDLTESAALITKGQRLISMERENKICWFIFENKKECEILSTDFFFGQLQVNAREFYEVIIRLKHRIFSQN